MILPLEVTNILIIISLTVITGALHLDGLADTCDGIGGHKTVEERRQVMHDSRVGSYGIVGVCMVLLAKYILLNSITVNLLMVTLVLMPVLSRWTMVFVLFIYPYARASGLGLEFKKATNWRRFCLATVLTLAVMLGLARWLGNTHSYIAVLTVMGGTLVIIIMLAEYLKHKFAGLSGDTYGAINEVAEVVVLIMISLLAYNHWLV
jgi:adenosylcobinamide-GDP ribazoletransferase